MMPSSAVCQSLQLVLSVIAAYQCPSLLHISASSVPPHRCPPVPPHQCYLSVPPHQCPSVLPISAV
ncbi:unnamed protein product, partial [Staurois parvus]